MISRFALLPLCVAGALGLGACGSSSSSSSSAGTSTASSSRAAARGAYGAGAYAAGAAASSSSTATASSSAATASSSAGGAATPSPAAVATAADPTGALRFVDNRLSAHAGAVTIEFTNDSSVGHNFTLQRGASGPIVGATPTFSGGVKTLTVHLAPGTYTFFCSVPGHRMAGMQGTLTVR